MSRIIAGSRRGRRITMPATDKTRPTTDRVREALFSAITSWAGTAAETADSSLQGLGFCDLFAGSGAVGLEAASRGADPVLLVEADKRTALTTSKNVSALGLPARVATMKVQTLVRQPAEVGYDVVFADPPYDLAAETVDDIVRDLVANGWVAADGLIVVERSRRSPDVGWPPGFGGGWSRRYGETNLFFGQADNLGP
ncbi:MAG: 16S rRNA (guanine(966)-N(2))-methyltransferase RsmD [Propionibacteriaceae bacterium]